MSRSYPKNPCRFCGKLIGGNMMTWHHREKCIPAIEMRAQERLESLRNRPVEKLTMGQAEECGRFEEWAEYIRAMRIARAGQGTIS